MPTITNDMPSPGSPDLSSGAEANRAGGAAGVETPVVVHASRYSSSATTLGKTLPPVHEETRTVIVFDQGAVVRLSADVTAGEVVVLTNKSTGADVICKVANVKAQPGIQSYVSLEFTQRAPGFWGESSQGVRAPQADTSPSVVAPPTFTSLAAPPAPSAKVSSVPIVAELTAPQPTRPAAPVPSSYEHQAVAPGMGESIASIPAAPIFSVLPSKEPETDGTLGTRLSIPPPVNLRPIELAIPSQDSGRGNKNITLIAVAAVALVAVGALGGWFLLRPSRSSAPVSQAAAIMPAPPAASQMSSQPEALPEANGTDVASLPSEPEAASSGAELRSEPLSEAHSESLAIQPAVAKSASEPKIAAPLASEKSAAIGAVPETNPRPVLDVGKMTPPSVRKKAATSTSSDAPPELLAQSGSVGSNSLSDNLLTASARSSGPDAPSPSLPSFASTEAKGGQLVQPKLLSSPGAIYPQQVRAQHIQGDVVIDAFIDENGLVAATKVISGPPALQQAAINAVRAWKYQPARLDGQPISIHIRVDVNFTLQ